MKELDDMSLNEVGEMMYVKTARGILYVASFIVSLISFSLIIGWFAFFMAFVMVALVQSIVVLDKGTTVATIIYYLTFFGILYYAVII